MNRVSSIAYQTYCITLVGHMRRKWAETAEKRRRERSKMDVTYVTCPDLNVTNVAPSKKLSGA